MADPKKLIAQTNIFSHNPSPDKPVVRDPYITSILPLTVESDTQTIMVKGSALDSADRVEFSHTGKSPVRVNLSKENRSNFELEIKNPHLSPGLWSIQLMSSSGKSNIFQLTFVAPTATENPAEPGQPVLDNVIPEAPIARSVREPQSRKAGRPKGQYTGSTKTVRIPLDLWKKIKHDATDSNSSMNDLAIDILYEHYKRK